MTAAGAAAAASVAASAAAVAAAASSSAIWYPPHGRQDTGPTAPRPFTTTRPPPIESLGVVYFTPLMDPLPVVTRQPQPAPGQDTVTQYVRLQSGGGSQRPDTYLWDMSLILHSYAPNDQESLAEDTLGDLLGWGANAQGLMIQLNSGRAYYVTYSKATGLATKQGDPYVDLTRYRGMVTWRVMGMALEA